MNVPPFIDNVSASGLCGKQFYLHGLDVGDALRNVTINVEENSLDITELYKAIASLKGENEILKKEVVELKKQMQVIISAEKK